jgi:hypothetical protein
MSSSPDRPPVEMLEADVARVRRLAQLLDSQFSIVGYRIGWDPIIGLVPVVGDLVTALIGIYPIVIARKHGLGGWLQARMGLNIFIDWLVGEIPLIGDLFDAAYKSNLKNADLLEYAVRRRLGQ